MALWLTNEDVQQVLDMKICVEELEQAFGALGHRIAPHARALGNRILRRNAHALSGAVVLEAVIGALDPVLDDGAAVQRIVAVAAAVLQRHDDAVAPAVHHHRLVQDDAAERLLSPNLVVPRGHVPGVAHEHGFLLHVPAATVPPARPPLKGVGLRNERAAPRLASFAKGGYDHRMGTTTMNISLPPALRKYVEKQVADGGYGSSSEYFRELLRLEQRRHAEERLAELIREGLESGEGTGVNEAYWASKRGMLKQWARDGGPGGKKKVRRRA